MSLAGASEEQLVDKVGRAGGQIRNKANEAHTAFKVPITNMYNPISDISDMGIEAESGGREVATKSWKKRTEAETTQKASTPLNEIKINKKIVFVVRDTNDTKELLNARKAQNLTFTVQYITPKLHKIYIKSIEQMGKVKHLT